MTNADSATLHSGGKKNSRFLHICWITVLVFCVATADGATPTASDAVLCASASVVVQ